MNPSERAIVELIRERYNSDSWAVFGQVPDATGLDKSRTADAIAMSLWPSRGLELHGFEVKVSRADWLKELNGNGAKAESIGQFCDRWWIVAPKDVVKKDELPKTWGLMVASKSGLRITCQAPHRESKPLDRSFIAGILRSADKYYEHEHPASKQAKEQYQRGYDDGLKQGNKSGLKDHERWDELNMRVYEFEKASGLNIEIYDGPKLGKIVYSVMNNSFELMASQAESIQKTLGRVKDGVDRLDNNLTELIEEIENK